MILQTFRLIAPGTRTQNDWQWQARMGRLQGQVSKFDHHTRSGQGNRSRSSFETLGFEDTSGEDEDYLEWAGSERRQVYVVSLFRRVFNVIS